jgi:flagellar hook-length control protein FliK
MAARPDVLAGPADLPGAAGMSRLTRAVAPVLPVARAVSAAELAVLSASAAPEAAIPISSLPAARIATGGLPAASPAPAAALPAAFGADRVDPSAEPSGIALSGVSSTVPVPETAETQTEPVAADMARRRTPQIAPGKPTLTDAEVRAGPKDRARDALPTAAPEDRAAVPETPPEPRPARRDAPAGPAAPETRSVTIAGFAPPEGPLPQGPESKPQPAGGRLTEPAIPAHDPAPVLGQVTGVMQHARAGITELRLSPEELGAVRIDLATEGDRASLVISAERQDTLDLMRRNADRLTGDLRAAGFQQLDLSFGRWSGQGQGAPTPHLPDIDPSAAREPAPTLAAERPVSPLGSAADPGRGLYLRI